jgi:predicted porin
MKKSLIALAIIAASGAASAQSSVTLYGLVDAYVGSVKVNNLKQTGINVPAASTGGGLNTSRFGFKGSEDLGGGLKANFLLEAGFDPSTGVANAYTNPYTGATSNAIFGRQSWVGLSGGFGEVKLGKMWTPYDEVKGSGAAGFDANIFAPATFVWASNSYNDRPGNSIYYSTPSFGGFTAAALYSFGENKANATATTPAFSAGHIAAVNVAYAGGPLAVALAYQVEKANGLVTDSTKYLQLNASYDFGVVKLLGAAGSVKNGFSPLTGVTVGTVTSPLAVEKTREYQLGLDFPVSSAFTLSGGFAWSKDNQYGGAPDLTRKGFGIAGLYALSKRTNLYVGFNSAKQESEVGFAEEKRRVIAAGVRHTF